MSTFTPHPEYRCLRIQANALATLLRGSEARELLLTAILRVERLKKRPVSQDELESERAANALLTEEVEHLRAKLSVYGDSAK